RMPILPTWSLKILSFSKIWRPVIFLIVAEDGIWNRLFSLTVISNISNEDSGVIRGVPTNGLAAWKWKTVFSMKMGDIPGPMDYFLSTPEEMTMSKMQSLRTVPLCGIIMERQTVPVICDTCLIMVPQLIRSTWSTVILRFMIMPIISG